MRRTAIAFLLATWGLAAHGAEGLDLSVQSRTQAAAASVATKHADAPFKAGRDPLPELLLRQELESRGPRGACENSAADLCYDMVDRRVVYRRARDYMPRIDGLTPESVSVRRDRIVFKYSF